MWELCCHCQLFISHLLNFHSRQPLPTEHRKAAIVKKFYTTRTIPLFYPCCPTITEFFVKSSLRSESALSLIEILHIPHIGVDPSSFRKSPVSLSLSTRPDRPSCPPITIVLYVFGMVVCYWPYPITARLPTDSRNLPLPNFCPFY